MKRRHFMRLAARFSGGLAALPVLQACGGGGGQAVSAGNNYKLATLVANRASYNPLILEPGLVNAWGIAIRPAGAGGHFWVTASGISFEYVGDVNGKPLYVDGLAEVALPPSSTGVGAANGVVFNPSTNFVITQANVNGPITAPAKFLFVSDNGVLSGWTERKKPDGTFDRPVDAVAILDDSAGGSSFFGLAMLPGNSAMLVVDFGWNPSPRLRYIDAALQEEPLGARFANPFLSTGGFKAGDLVPFNAQTVTIGGEASVFVAYVNSSSEPAVEDAGRGRGRLVEYTASGERVAIWDDRGALNAPWGVVVCPPDYGPFSNQLLVGNFADGTILGFDTVTRSATEYMRDVNGNTLAIAGLWGLLFGNGASLGDSNALYFAAGPADETDGVFGSLRLVGA